MGRSAVMLGALVVLSACEQTSPSVVEMNSPDPSHFLLASPDPTFRLTDEQRAGLSPLIDPFALEKLLARIRPEHREMVLTDLNEIGSQGRVAFGPMTIAIPDPELRAAVAALFRVPPDQGKRRP